MAQNILYGERDELLAIREELKAYEGVNRKIDEYTIINAKLKKDIEAEEKLLNDTIDSTIRKRRDQVVSNFDKDLRNTQDKLKKVKGNREKAKAKGIQGRIKIETDDLVQENKNLKEEIRTYFKQKGIPGLFTKKLFYSLFFPNNIKDLIALLCLIMVFVIAIPVIAVKIVHWHIILEILLFICLAAIVPVIYYLLFRYIRITHKSEFMEKREQRIRIDKNNRQIKRIIKSIHKDKNEESYNLNSFDNEIDDLEDYINDIVRKKNQVLEKFETTTKLEITEEITEREQPKIEKLRKQLNETQIELKSYNESQQNMSLKISSNYAAYLGNEYMTVAKIDKLIRIMDDGNAKTIGDAINVMKIMN